MAAAFGMCHFVAIAGNGREVMYAVDHDYIQKKTDDPVRMQPKSFTLHSSVLMVAAGKLHAAAIDNDRRLYLWGLPSCARNFYVQSLALPSVPKVFGQICADMVACGHFHTVVQSGSRLFTFGKSDFGALCLGEVKEVNTLTEVDLVLPSGYRHECVFVAAGGSRTAFIDQTGSVRGCGEKMLYGGHDCGRMSKQSCATLCGKAAYVSVGPSHCLMINEDGVGFTWGSGLCGKLGVGHMQNLVTPTPVCFHQLWPWPTQEQDCKLKMGWCGLENTFAVSQTGQLWGWGKIDIDRIVPMLLPTLTNNSPVVAVNASYEKAMLLHENGRVNVWGRGSCIMPSYTRETQLYKSCHTPRDDDDYDMARCFGHWHCIAEVSMLAFCMAWHPRLGKDSTFCNLPDHLFEMLGAMLFAKRKFANHLKGFFA